ncbi:MAG: DUF3089 domain-containing protein [Flexilinea sp.]|nr:DUF3089 domain-containing protein [Flexilinea sp.]
MKTIKLIIFVSLIIGLLCGFTVGMAQSDEYLAEAPLDYSEAANWIIYNDLEETDVDFFCVAPTVSSSLSHNMFADDVQGLTAFLIQTNIFKDIFAPDARTFSPVYRQITLTTYALPFEEWQPYFDFAYRDVSAAFDYYLKNENNGRPIILMGFSQGAYMSRRLMQEYFGDEKLASQLVAAYLIGWPITEELVNEYPQLKMAQGEGDTGVIVSFDCEAPDVTESLINPAGQKALSINPLNWKTDSTPADKSLNKGSRLVNGRGEVKREETELCGAYIDPDRGVLKVTDIDAADYKPVIPVLAPGVLHIYDTQFFYRNLKDNAALRLQNYLEKHN